MLKLLYIVASISMLYLAGSYLSGEFGVIGWYVAGAAFLVTLISWGILKFLQAIKSAPEVRETDDAVLTKVEIYSGWRTIILIVGSSAIIYGGQYVEYQYGVPEWYLGVAMVALFVIISLPRMRHDLNSYLDDPTNVPPSKKEGSE